MWLEVFLYLVNFGKDATTSTQERQADGGGGGRGAVVAFVSEEKVVWVEECLRWQMEVKAVKALLGPWQQWFQLQEV